MVVGSALAGIALYLLSGDPGRAARLVVMGTVLAAVFAAFAAWAAMTAARASTDVTGHLTETLATILSPRLQVTTALNAEGKAHELRFIDDSGQGVLNLVGEARFRSGLRVPFSIAAIQGTPTPGMVITPGPGGGYPVSIVPPQPPEEFLEAVSTGWDRGHLVQWTFRTYRGDDGALRMDRARRVSGPHV